ncbi:MAG TPA: asparagine synthase-related protein [Planctomycetota bacterium]|nr:asparagine synthase-related protein [Planctomycetota bacterium]
MAGIAGIAAPGRRADVERMLEALRHRGSTATAILNLKAATLGVVAPRVQSDAAATAEGFVRDFAGDGHLAQAQVAEGRLVLTRDPIGVAPLYTGRDQDGTLCFASEVKALLAVTRDVHEVPPGNRTDGETLEPFFLLEKHTPVGDPPEAVAAELRRRLEAAVKARLVGDLAGSWLSGGLDSSAMAALARPHVRTLHTFAGGLPGAPDLEHAREVADFIGSEHHEVVASFDDVLRALPRVIYHLESFDALLVRSSVLNYLVAKAASEHAPMAFSGEGGDELFAGYDYLKSLPREALADELIDITGRLHNTALQRVDRSAAAHGLVPHVCFLDPSVVEYALRVPVELKLRDGVEKWILRQAMAGALPDRVLNRPKAKFWQGSGVGELLADHAETAVSDADFRRERSLANGWTLNTKEELLYYRLFKEHFGELTQLDWMGRTKGAPRVP